MANSTVNYANFNSSCPCYQKASLCFNLKCFSLSLFATLLALGISLLCRRSLSPPPQLIAVNLYLLSFDFHFKAFSSLFIPLYFKRRARRPPRRLLLRRLKCSYGLSCGIYLISLMPKICYVRYIQKELALTNYKRIVKSIWKNKRECHSHSQILIVEEDSSGFVNFDRDRLKIIARKKGSTKLPLMLIIIIILWSGVGVVKEEGGAFSAPDKELSYSDFGTSLIKCSSRLEFELGRWLIANSPRYGIVIDAAMRDHIVLLFRLCLKAITREAVGSVDLLLKREMMELNMKTMCFSCPMLGQALMWLGTQLAVLYGEMNGKLFAVEMLKQSLLNDSLNYVMISQVQKIEEVDQKIEEPIKNREKGREMIFVSQVAAAVAALHERSLFEGKITAIRSSQKLASFQRMAEHSYVSKKADEERQKRSNYRPIVEHDGLLWQRARNQETNKMKSREELLAEERDYKRRRMSYRGKKMKRSTTQVMREIIEEFMEEIKQAGGSGCLPKGAEEAGMLASKTSSFHDSSTDSELKRSESPHGYKKHIVSNNSTKSTRFKEESPEDEKRHRQDSHKQNAHIEDQIGERNRHVREYYSRSPDRQRIYDRTSEQDDAEMSRKHFPKSSNRSHSRSRGHNSHRRYQVDQNVEEKDTRRRSRQRYHRSDSVTRHEFEDRYDPSRSRDMYEDDV
ncbi:hypothetical protein LguiB_035557 [Lonicera macranthoides]